MNREYKNYESFITDFIISVMEDEVAAMIINYKDYQGVLASLNSRVLNGKTLVVEKETVQNFDEDIADAMNGDGNILITVFDNALIVGEPIVFASKAESFIDCKYYVEKDAMASAIHYAISPNIISFSIKEKKIIVKD